MIRLKLYFVWILNKYVSFSCNFNEKLIKLQRKLLDNVKAKTEVQDNG